MQFLDYLAEQPLVIELWGSQSDKDEAFGQVKAPSKRMTGADKPSRVDLRYGNTVLHTVYL